VLSGKGLGKTLIESEFIPCSAAEMVLTAERTGSLGGVTKLIGEYFEEEGEEKLRGLIVVVEPAITVVMGVIVAFVVLAVALPMFDLATFAQK
jgi:type II secretory pathway component PulF